MTDDRDTSPDAPRVLKVARLDADRPVGRREVLKGAVAVAAAGVASAVPDRASAKRDTESRADVCITAELRAFEEPVRRIVAGPGGRYLAAVDVAGNLQAWALRRPGQPLLDRPAKAVRSVAVGSSMLVALEGDKLVGRLLDDGDQKLFSLPAGDIRRLFLLGPEGPLLCQDEDGLVLRRDAWTGKPERGWSIRPTAGGVPIDQLLPGRDGLWMRAGERLYRAAEGARAWTPVPFEGERSVVLAPDDRVGFASGGLARVADLPGLEERAQRRLPEGARSLAWDGLLATAARLTDDRGQLRVVPMEGGGGVVTATTRSLSIRALVGLPRRGGYAWGDARGRLGACYLDGPDRLTVVPFASPDLTEVAVLGGQECPDPDDPACTCNTVSATRGEEMVGLQTWDKHTESWIHSVQACGSPIPAGAICTCNCVAASGRAFELGCVCDEVCTCNTVCTCQSVGGGGGSYSYSYWYPN